MGHEPAEAGGIGVGLIEMVAVPVARGLCEGLNHPFPNRGCVADQCLAGEDGCAQLLRAAGPQGEQEPLAGGDVALGLLVGEVVGFVSPLKLAVVDARRGGVHELRLVGHRVVVSHSPELPLLIGRGV